MKRHVKIKPDGGISVTRYPAFLVDGSYDHELAMLKARGAFIYGFVDKESGLLIDDHFAIADSLGKEISHQQREDGVEADKYYAITMAGIKERDVIPALADLKSKIQEVQQVYDVHYHDAIPLVGTINNIREVLVAVNAAEVPDAEIVSGLEAQIRAAELQLANLADQMAFAKSRIADHEAGVAEVNAIIIRFLEDKYEYHLEQARILIDGHELEEYYVDPDELPEKDVLGRDAWIMDGGKVKICPERHLAIIRKHRNHKLEILDAKEVAEGVRPNGNIEAVRAQKQLLRDLPGVVNLLSFEERAEKVKELIPEIFSNN